MIIENSSRQYHVGALVAETAEYRLYLCSQEAGGSEQLLQIATDVAHNGELDRAAYILRLLLERSDELEGKYAQVKTDERDMLNHQLGFPSLVDSFVLAGQGNRRVNILGFRNVEDVRAMVPLSNITKRDHRRVDLRTSVWILGKTLKTLFLAHGMGLTNNQMASGNFLLELKEHYVVVFNWASAQKHPDGVSREDASSEIKLVAQAVIEVLGGTMEGGIPDDGTKDHLTYVRHLMHLARNGNDSAFDAHQSFYKLADQLWPRGYHPL